MTQLNADFEENFLSLDDAVDKNDDPSENMLYNNNFDVDISIVLDVL